MKPTLLIGIVEVALAGFLGYNMLYLPKQREVQRVRAQQGEERTHQQTQTEVAAYLQQIERYRKRLPPEPDPAWLVRELVDLAKEPGVQLTSISQDEPQSLGQFTRLAVRLQLSATYHQLGSFLDAVERSDHFMRVDRLDIQQQGSTDRPAIQLTFSTLYVSPLTTAAANAGR